VTALPSWSVACTLMRKELPATRELPPTTLTANLLKVTATATGTDVAVKMVGRVGDGDGLAAGAFWNVNGKGGGTPASLGHKGVAGRRLAAVDGCLAVAAWKAGLRPTYPGTVRPVPSCAVTVKVTALPALVLVVLRLPMTNCVGRHDSQGRADEAQRIVTAERPVSLAGSHSCRRFLPRARGFRAPIRGIARPPSEPAVT